LQQFAGAGIKLHFPHFAAAFKQFYFIDVPSIVFVEIDIDNAPRLDLSGTIKNLLKRENFAAALKLPNAFVVVCIGKRR
jgi:hypothetical protein